jgi:hypothetical protein
MAVVTVKSTVITNRDATPPVLSNDYLARSLVYHAGGIVTVTNGDSIASAYKIATIPSNAFISAVILSNDAITGASATFDLYDTTANGGAIVPTTGTKFISDAISIATAATDKFILGSGAAPQTTNANGEKRVWEVLGLTADPVKFYDVVMTLTVAATATGVASLNIYYSV